MASHRSLPRNTLPSSQVHALQQTSLNPRVLGDHVASAQSIGEQLDIKDIVSEHAPNEKLRFIEDMQLSLGEKGARQSGVLMVGDGMTANLL